MYHFWTSAMPNPSRFKTNTELINVHQPPSALKASLRSDTRGVRQRASISAEHPPKYHVVTLTDGTPLGAIVSKANVNDTRLLPHLLKLAHAVCASIAKLFADASYDSSFNRAFCRKQRVELII